jgi:hypothetical protein
MKARVRSSGVNPQGRDAIGVGAGVLMTVGAGVETAISLGTGVETSKKDGAGVRTVPTEVGKVVTFPSMEVGRVVTTTFPIVGAGVFATGFGVGLFDVGNDMACVIRVQNSMSSVSSLCLSTPRVLVRNSLFSAAAAVPPNKIRAFAAILMYIVLSCRMLGSQLEYELKPSCLEIDDAAWVSGASFNCDDGIIINKR